jgi:hypothetical protein
MQVIVVFLIVGLVATLGGFSAFATLASIISLVIENEARSRFAVSSHSDGPDSPIEIFPTPRCGS